MISKELILNWIRDKDEADGLNVHVPPLNSELIRQCPIEWRGVLARKVTVRDFVAQSWGADELFPKTVKVLLSRLQGIVLLQKKTDQKLRLLYIFYSGHALRIFSGGEPAHNLHKPISSLAVDLSFLYRIHDGFVDFADGISGISSLDNVEILDNGSNIESTNGFLKIFEIGTNCLGFNLSESLSKTAYIIWGSEEDVEQVADFWQEIDDWVATILEDYDPVET